jgi:outer membrane lipoprotein-sorting protein
MNNKTNCEDRCEVIMALVLDELEPIAADKLRRHIDACQICRDLYQALADEEEMVRSAFDQIVERTKTAEATLAEQLDRQLGHRLAPLGHLRGGLRTIAKLAAVIMIGILLLGGVTFWPSGNGKEDKWWLGPPAAWGREMLQSLEKAEALVYRKRTASVSDYGLVEMKVGWSRVFSSEDAYRCDRYDYRDGTKIDNTQWILRDPEGSTRYEVSFEYQCYFQEETEWSLFYDNQIDSLRWYVGLLDKANRILNTEIFDGRECVGFEIKASEYGDNPEGRFDRIWFDVETKLPARIEKHGISSSFDAAQTYTFIDDQFEYYAEVPVDIFTPQIPEGFVNAHPDDIRAARKGEMTFADIPDGLKDEIVTALRSTKTVVYRQGDRTVYLSPNAWRYDYYFKDRLLKTEWYVFKEIDTKETGFEIEDKDIHLIRTIINFDSQTYEVSGYPKTRHPMHGIIFLAGLVDRADRMLEKQIIDEIECFGFEISAKKYGDNPDTSKHRLWFDAQTKLPVRMEHEWWQNDGTKKSVRVLDQFEWDPELEEDTFVPKIPAGFVMIEPNDK